MTYANSIPFLTHGTSERAFEKILSEGLKPRGKGKGNWTVRSAKDRVYLTDCYAPYYAMTAAEDQGGRWGVIEVDLSLTPNSTDMLLPDEDFLEQATRDKDNRNWNLPRRTAFYRKNAWLWRNNWTHSLDHLGTVAHHGEIPPEAITRAALFDPRKSPRVASLIDPTITILNHAICGASYRAITGWILGYETTAKNVMLFHDYVEKTNPAEIVNIGRELSERTGIETVLRRDPENMVALA